MRHFHVTIAVVEKQQVPHILCVCLYYVACKADCHMASVALPYFFHLINGKVFGEKIIEHKMFAFIFSVTFV